MFHRRSFLLILTFTLLLTVHFFLPSSRSQGSNHSILLNGTSAYVDVPYNANLNITGALTLEAWVKTSSTPYQHVIERGDWWQNQMSYALSVGEGKVRLDIMQSNGSYATVIGNTAMSLNAWHHIAGVYDGSQMRVYLDGVLNGTATATYTPGNNATGLRIGKSSFLYYPNYFNGRIDEVRVSNAAIYSSNFVPSAHLTATGNTKGLWKFDGQTANDSSSSGAHGSLQGSASYSTDVPTGPNAAPTISITDPLNNTNFAAGSNVVIDASASDSDGTVTQVEFLQGSTLLGSDSTAPYTFVWNSVAAGSYAISARATDNAGATTTSTPITITLAQAGGDRSVLFNGTSSYVEVPYNANLNITGALTVEAWVKTSSTAYQQVVERGDWWQNQMSYGLIVGEGKVRLDIMQSNGSYATVIGNTAMSLNAWHHIAGVYDGSQMRVYLDGVLNGTATATYTPGNNATGLRIGKSSFLYYPNYFNGRIDEVRVSNAAIYTSNFTPNAHLTATGNTKGLWKFDGETTNDGSASGANGSLQGGASYSSDVPIGAGGGPQIPVAMANGPYSAQLAQAINFSSSGSFDPDGSISSYHWNFGDGTSANTANPSHAYQTSGLFTATLTVTDNSGLRSSATASVNISGASEARLDPLNETGGGGENPLSRNFNWNLPLLSLPGRAGMDLGLTLSYNSLVWTKSSNGNYISFDEDHGFPSPGFRLGFPVIQPIYYNAQVGKYAYLLIGPDGSRTELRQVATSMLYEAADSSHLLLDASTMTLRTTDGTQLSYILLGGEFQCTQIKDRNGNFISISYNAAGRLSTVTDTLNRVITFNYDGSGSLTSLTQDWNQHATAVTHYWARFEYANTTINTAFGALQVSGPANNTTIKTLSRVKLADDSYHDFSYTSWGQVWKITSFAADNSVLNYRTYNLPLTATPVHNDCPRFTVRKDWARYWNGDTDGTMATNEEVATATFLPAVSASWTMPDGSAQTGMRAEVTVADGTLNKLFYIGVAGTSSGWRRGLPALVETHSGGAWKRKVMTTWTQDNPAVSYPLNPRVLETNVYDPEGNRARTEITYEQFDLGNNMSCRLPRDVYEYAANATTKLRSTRTLYHMSATYKNLRILGLVSEKQLYEGDANAVGAPLKSKVGFFYDESGSIQGSDAPVQHDNTNYTASYVSGRGNLSSVKRYNVDNTAEFTTMRMKYNTAGAVVSSKDALEHEVTISYTDSFSDGISRNTLAYPTTVTDPDHYSSTTKYNFDFGAVTSKRTPQPNVTTNTPGPEQFFEFDSIGRLKKLTNSVNSAYTRFEYSNTLSRVDTYTTIQEGLGEAHSFAITDGAGRVLATATDHPGSVGGFSGQKLVYDVMGRVIKTSNPTETSASGHPSQWTTAGDDAAAGWIYTQQTYDWKGRPLVTTNQDGTTRTASYSGCGCAGGEVVTLTDEGTLDAGVSKKRQQRIYSDVLGRVFKSEILNWDGAGPNGTNGTVYSTNVTAYNARDQITSIRQYQGTSASTTFQDTTMAYDGFGRLKTQHKPEQQAIPNNTASSDHTTFYYNADDTLSYIVDARGVKKIFSYNDRHSITEITYDTSLIPSPFDYVTATAGQTFSYDAAGNRSSMIDGTGTTSYQYDGLSRLSSETRNFAGPFSGTAFTMIYDYNFGGEIKSLTLPSQFGTNLTYDYDRAGRLTTVTGSGYTYTDNSNPQQPFEAPISNFLSNALYRAWNDLKQMNTGSVSATSFSYNQRLQSTSYTLSAGSSSYTWNYQYFADGRMRMASDLANDHFDKAYAYDHWGRMTEGSSGREARGLLPTSPTPDSPYRQSFAYNAFSQQIRETGRIWQQQLSGQTYAYSNNRRTDLLYDAEGNVIADAQGSHVYDAAGQRTNATAGMVGGGQSGHPEAPAEERSLTYDANGQPVRSILVSRVETLTGEGPQTFISQDVETTYYLRSTVLGGYVIAELNSQGQKTKQYVYAGGERLAQHVSSTGLNTINWQHRNPLTDSWISFDPNHAFSFRTEVDVHGRETGVEPPTILPNEPPPPPTRSPAYLEMGGAPTLEAELGMQLYEDVYINKIFDAGHGPGEGGYDRLRTVREFQLRAGGTFLLGMARLKAIASPWDFELVPDSVMPGWEKGEHPVSTPYYRLKPGSRARKVGNQPLTDKQAAQDTVTEPIHWWDLAKIRTDLKAIAARGRCQEFLTKLLEKAGATGGDTAVHTNIVDLFDAVLFQQGFVTQKEVTGRGFSSVRGAVGAPGGAQVLLSNGSNDFTGKLRIQYFAYDALSELTHVAGSKPSTYATGAFSDYHLAKTALDVANEMGTGIPNLKLTLPTVDPNNDPFGRWSGFYHGIVKLYCPRQERF